MMVKLPTNTRLKIRQHSVELVWGKPQEAIVSFELFSYPANNGGAGLARHYLVEDRSLFPKRAAFIDARL